MSGLAKTSPASGCNQSRHGAASNQKLRNLLRERQPGKGGTLVVHSKPQTVRRQRDAWRNRVFLVVNRGPGASDAKSQALAGLLTIGRPIKFAA